MLSQHASRVLVVADTATPDHALLDAIRERAAASACQFRVVVTNPARAEVHLLHPERHDRAREAELVLRQNLVAMEAAAGTHVIGSVSVFHDPMDAIEHILDHEPVDEVILAVAAHPWATRIHQDLPHRLAHLGLPITTVDVPGHATH
jgi:hypothetical protein